MPGPVDELARLPCLLPKGAEQARLYKAYRCLRKDVAWCACADLGSRRSPGSRLQWAWRCPAL